MKQQNNKLKLQIVDVAKPPTVDRKEESNEEPEPTQKDADGKIKSKDDPHVNLNTNSNDVMK